jgi:hypothetical protein
MKHEYIKGGIKEMKDQHEMKRKLKAMSQSERRRYGVPTSDGGIDLLTAVAVASMFSSVEESGHSFSGGGGDFGGGGASSSWDSSSSSSDCGGSCGGDCGGGGGGGD